MYTDRDAPRAAPREEGARAAADPRRAAPRPGPGPGAGREDRVAELEAELDRRYRGALADGEFVFWPEMPLRI